MFYGMLALLHRQTIQDTLRLRRRTFNDRAILCLFHGKRTPAVGAGVAHSAGNDRIGGFFRMGRSTVTLMAGNAAAFILGLLFRRILFEGYL